MTPEAISALFAKRTAAFARRDVATLVDDYLEDCIVESPTLGTIQGRF